ncbi:hypothetical protein PINS_up020608 [Pythium insidiosum]|nr:hypothetical protein PINS_up020608 [Pythium insidiosum]
MNSKRFCIATSPNDVRVDVMRGREALVEQCRRFSALFKGLRVSLQRVKRRETVGDGVQLEARAQLDVTITAASLWFVFPGVQVDERLKSKLLGVRLSCPLTLLYELDWCNRIVCLDWSVDVVSALRRLLSVHECHGRFHHRDEKPTLPSNV